MKTIVCLLAILLFSFTITAQAQIQYEVNQPARIPTPPRHKQFVDDHLVWSHQTGKLFVDPNHYFPGDLSRGQAVDPPVADIPEEQNNLSQRKIHKRPVSQTEGMTNEDYQAWRNFIGSDLFGTKASDQQKRIRREVK